jgi:RNA polymerase sigma factor (sigma-70 family)
MTSRPFETLVQRYGQMVLRVRLRTLGHVHDAEDALQASFLVLARQAASIRKRESLASWLHGVSYRMATHAKRAGARRRGHESRANPTPPRDPALSVAWQELQVLLDKEIESLPETLRESFVSCCLENRSCAEAAHHLNLQVGTVRKRLSRARKLLQVRLTRRGVSLASVLAAAAVGANGAQAALPASLVGPTIKAAALLTAGQALAAGPISAQVISLAEGVNRAMFVSKCKTVLLLLVFTGLAGTGFGLAAFSREAVLVRTASPWQLKPWSRCGASGSGHNYLHEYRIHLLDALRRAKNGCGSPARMMSSSRRSSRRTANLSPRLPWDDRLAYPNIYQVAYHPRECTPCSYGAWLVK